VRPHANSLVRPELSPRRLLAAYASGAFPMPDPQTPRRVLWFSPDPRGLLPLDDRFHVARRLRRTIRQGRFACTLDAAFEKVMRCCADREEGTWITDEFLSAYGRLHELGLAHSVEVWPAENFANSKSNSSANADAPPPARCAGGVYGVAVGGAFFAESTFHRLPDAGNVAIVHLIEHLRRQGFGLCDIQWLTPHFQRKFGAFQVPRAEYLSLLSQAIARPVRFA